jgi:hemerythrin-like domain-containing protein
MLDAWHHACSVFVAAGADDVTRREETQMTPTIDNLVHEHRLILAALDSLESLATRVDAGDKADRRDVAQFADFFRGFADTCHHGKEEDILFTALVDAGFPKGSGPIGVMLHEHELGRRLVRRIRELGDRVDAWTPTDSEEFVGAARSFVNLLRDHIAKEDDILYPMAEAHLSAMELERIRQMFELFESQRTGSGEHQRLQALAETLLAKYPALPSPNAPSNRRVDSCCGL